MVMFQPHRYSRTQALQNEFGAAFRLADRVFVADVYAASEKPIPGVTGQTIVDAIARAGLDGAQFVPVRQQIPVALGPLIETGDLILSLGAGDIHEQGAQLATDLAKLEELRAAMGPGVTRLYEPLAPHTTRCAWAAPRSSGSSRRPRPASRALSGIARRTRSRFS